MKYKLIFGVRDVTARNGEREATGLEAAEFFDVHPISQIILEVTPADIEKHMAPTLANMPELKPETVAAMKQSFIRENMQAALDLMLRSMAMKVVDHVERGLADADQGKTVSH